MSYKEKLAAARERIAELEKERDELDAECSSRLIRALKAEAARDARPDISPEEAACVTVTISCRRPQHTEEDMETGQRVKEKLLVHAHKADRPASQMPRYS